MPRRPRIELEGGIHHVTARGNRGQAIFRDERDRADFVGELRRVCDRYTWICLSYCLMTNHIHLVLETPHRTLGMGMRSLAGRHAQRLNSRHGTYGHVFQGRFGSVLVRTDEQFAQLLRYVALNPVAAGLCAEPGSWPWSGHSALLRWGPSSTVDADRVEERLACWGGASGGRYARLFEPECALAVRYGNASPWEWRPPLSDLLDADDLDQGMRAAHEQGYRLAEIAEAVDLHPSTVSRRVTAAFGARTGSVPQRAGG